jgi:thiaminase
VPLSELLRVHEDAWRRATRHEFLDRVSSGSLPESAFERWLVQDYLFVADLLRFQARLLAQAPRPAQAVLAEGASGLVAELDWFELHALERGLRLDARPLPPTANYSALLDRLTRAPFSVAIAALWAIERAYLDAWTSAAPAAPPYDEFVAHWTSAEFCAYVDALESAADEAGAVGDVFLEVAEAEAALWGMALA